MLQFINYTNFKYITILKQILLLVFVPIISVSQNQNNINDSVVYKRLQLVEKTIKLPYSKVVLEQIRQNVYANKTELEKSISLYKNYEPIFEREILKNNLPDELKYLPFAISEMNNRMIGKYGTAGVWGLPISVAVKHGLIVTPFVDERLDIEKSTKVALRYIMELYDIYSDWWKTIIAFSNSPAALNSTIIRLKDKDMTIWDIYDNSKLPFRLIIPNYIYSVYIINYMNTYDLKIKPVIMPDCSFVKIKGEILVSDLIDKINISDTLFYLLNPVYTSSRIPAYSHYPIQIPKSKEDLFKVWEDSLYKWAITANTPFFIPDSLEEIIEDDSSTDIQLFNDSIIIEIDEKNIEKTVEKQNTVVEEKKKPTNNSYNIVYIVKSGDVLSKIAEKHNVDVKQIKEWNNLKSDNIKTGQKLIIQSKKTNSTKSNSPSEIKPKKNEKYKYYTVKKGDTLWSIAQRYDTTDDEIKKINGIGNSIHPGQVLKIKIIK